MIFHKVWAAGCLPSLTSCSFSQPAISRLYHKYHNILIVCKRLFLPGIIFHHRVIWPGVLAPLSPGWITFFACPTPGGGTGHGNVHHYTLISNAPQPINNNSQSGKLPRVFKAWPYTAHLGCVELWRANINYGFQKGQNVGNSEILHAQMFVYVCAMLRHNAHCVVRPTTERRVRREEGVLD